MRGVVQKPVGVLGLALERASFRRTVGGTRTQSRCKDASKGERTIVKRRGFPHHSLLPYPFASLPAQHSISSPPRQSPAQEGSICWGLARICETTTSKSQSRWPCNAHPLPKLHSWHRSPSFPSLDSTLVRGFCFKRVDVLSAWERQRSLKGRAKELRRRPQWSQKQTPAALSWSDICESSGGAVPNCAPVPSCRRWPSILAGRD